MTGNYGWHPDKPDHRDLKYAIHRMGVEAPEDASKLVTHVDLTAQMPPVYDQGELGSCTGNSIAAGFQFERMKQKLANWVPSRLFIYYFERLMEGTVNEDAGAQIRDGIKVIATNGVPEETLWPYNPTEFAIKPTTAAIQFAEAHKATQYMRLDGTKLSELKTCLAAGYPFVFGFTVYPAFESEEVAKTGVCPMPDLTTQPVGGHAVLCVGYDDASQTFRVRNSWGPDWGQKGYFTIPYAYLTNPDLAQDFWTIRLVNA
jgi:C1A family cysteine protease